MMAGVLIELPGVPQGKGRPRFARRGKFISTYTPETTRTYESMLQGAALVVATSFVLINLLVDVLYAWLDPRIRYS